MLAASACILAPSACNFNEFVMASNPDDIVFVFTRDATEHATHVCRAYISTRLPDAFASATTTPLPVDAYTLPLTETY